MKPSTISIFGNFGTQNLGNECTLQAVIHNVRQYVPDAPLRCICTDPEDTSRRYSIPAVAMSSGYGHREASSSSVRRRRTHPLLRVLRGIVIRLPRELMHWMTAFKTLKGSRMLIMAGTGMLDDFGIRPFDLHYEIFKWSLLAKLRGCKLLFVSVGTGQLEHPLSRWFVKAALALADYRSYRDRFSRDLLDDLGIAARRDFVYPDLVFSFPRPEVRRESRRRTGPVVGLGLMEYYGKGCRPEDGRAVYHAYIDKVTTFVAWLLERGYTVRLLIGDVVYDGRASHDVIGRLRERHVVYDERRLIHGPVSSVDQLIFQLAQSEIVVASRFHNVLLALMLTKPVVSISYYGRKNEALMAEMGLAEYCQRIDDLDPGRLIEQFRALEERTETLAPFLEQKTEEYRAALERQYTAIFDQVLHRRPERGVHAVSR